MLMNGVMPMPPAMKTAGRARSLCRVSDPNGPSIAAREPMGKAFSARLKALSRMRVATTSSFSNGALTIEKVWRALGASAVDGSSSTTSIAWPGLKTKPAGFSKWNAIVPVAISSLPCSLALCVVMLRLQSK